MKLSIQYLRHRGRQFGRSLGSLVMSNRPATVEPLAVAEVEEIDA